MGEKRIFRTLDELRDVVGRERFERACAWAWATAAGTGRGLGASPGPEEAMVPHDLADPVWYENEAPMLDRLRLAFDLYEAMPCYGNLMYIQHFFDKLDDASSELFWARFCEWLGHGDDRLADPAAYSLWVDYFEDRDTVEEAWRRTTSEATALQLRRVVEASGPVPWSLKARLYAELAREPQWHRSLFEALCGSAFDVFGDIDHGEAEALLRRLHLPDETRVPLLREELANPRRGPGTGR